MHETALKRIKAMYEMSDVALGRVPAEGAWEEVAKSLYWPWPCHGQAQAHGTWYLVPGTWYQVPGTWHLGYLVPGTWSLVPGTRYQGPVSGYKGPVPGYEGQVSGYEGPRGLETRT